MTVRRVWFNKTFSSVHNVIRLLQRPDAPVRCRVRCTHTNPEFVGFQLSDEWAVEPLDLTDEAYVQYCLEVCQRRKIDVFIPGKASLAIAEARDRFEEIGVRLLLAAAPEWLRLFEEKGAFYAQLDAGLVAAPRFIAVNTVAEFAAACATLRAEGRQVCFKPAVSTGGLGFKILDDRRSDARNLLGGEPVRLTTALAAHILGQEPRFRDLLVMEYLDGPEYSVDCLGARGRLVRAISRRKPIRAGGTQWLEENPALLAVAERLTERYRLDGLYNIQLRYAGGVPKLLEINARMSGGIYFACLAGVNLPAWAVALACGDAREADVPKPQLGRAVSQQYQEFLFNVIPAEAGV